MRKREMHGESKTPEYSVHATTSCQSEWDDARRWVPNDVFGQLSGDVYHRLVAVANGRWFFLPFLRTGETFDFLLALFVFAAKYDIHLAVWRHPGTDLSGFAELIGSTDWASQSARIAA